MDDKNKSGKPRDISDLKARLGLVKPGAAAPASAPNDHSGATGQQPAAPTNPFAQPMRPAIRGPFPAPPGMAPAAQPAAAPPPDARSDPFGAMSATVATNAAAMPRPAPYVFVDDGKPVESVAARGAHRAARLTLGAILVLGALVGFWWGGIVVDRKMYNRSIDDAVNIKVEVDSLAKRLSAVVDVLNASTAKYPNFQPDFDLTEKLKAIDLTPPDQQKLFHTNYARFEDIAIDELFNYYNDTIAMYEQIRRHVAATEKEKDLLKAFAEQAKTQDVNYGVTLENQGRVPVAKLVQIIEPLCKGGKADCKNVADLDGFRVTYSPGGTPFDAKIAGTGVKVMPLEHTQMFDGMVSGARPEALAGSLYKRRIFEIRVLTARLMTVQKSLLQHLDARAKMGKVFTL